MSPCFVQVASQKVAKGEFPMYRDPAPTPSKCFFIRRNGCVTVSPAALKKACQEVGIPYRSLRSERLNLGARFIPRLGTNECTNEERASGCIARSGRHGFSRKL